MQRSIAMAFGGLPLELKGKSMNKTIVANWKMNGSRAFIEDFLSFLTPSLITSPYQIILCPPFPYLFAVSKALKNTPAHLGAQNCHIAPEGAFTGETSAFMLSDLGCKAVIIGHSERRAFFNETDELIKAKVTAAHAAGLTAIVCIGESLNVRQAGRAIETVIQQLNASLPSSSTLQNTMVAYEPIWAIGTGLTPSLEEIEEMHQALLSDLPLLYGGSVTDKNIKEILALPHVNGVLVGGASLKTDIFKKMIS